ncbi:PadR family transcriptional regulator [Glycomyces algeriensis]|uniref:Transcriptional regulator n=1 Tax=Glycomyces algeriensis TaxID=256037 RepID=A0A9W6LH46_9ACTN|nr:PadR family transcriptional regulator [Glycomyces algeriensis]MDA1365273.1 PadR family transcriptional regulator [Glycomyces algeriensis]MDR7349664.1 DNA-binding PadR family transcriptional regulator [Glycomyces algeriensis]GLI42374.1 transcriptional regulator [Glycomyces algeriensis]
MSVKHSLLALLERGPAYGYQLRAAFESATGNTWPLNIGQVYTTLNRLERDELVEALPENDSGQRPYRITETGRRHLAGWFASPVQAADRPRDELTIKLALAVTTPGVDVADVIQRQRGATLRLLQEYTRLKAAEEHAELAWRLVLESMIFRAEAEIRWLDHTEAVVARAELPAPFPFAVDEPDSADATPERNRTRTH